MSDRPILFSSPMVLALLDGRKTQDRRVLRPASVSDQWPGTMWPVYINGRRCGESSGDPEASRLPDDLGGLFTGPTPIVPGGRLWVRETWAHYQTVNYVRRSHGRAFSEVSDGLAGYRADGHDTIKDFRDHVRLMSGCDLEAIEINGDRWRPSIHMPRWASRITLTVTDVRVQRLHDITEEDAAAEGVPVERYVPVSDSGGLHSAGEAEPTDLIEEYHLLWEGLHGPGSWEANPWVAAYTFTVALDNIDILAESA